MITARHIDVLRHALGADSKTPGYRNFFDPGGDDVQLCLDLSAAGLMEPFGNLGAGICYRATDVGIRAVLSAKDIKRMERAR